MSARFSAIEAALRSQYAAGIINKNAYVLRDVLHLYNGAQQRRRKKIERELEIWDRYVEQQRKAITDAISKYEPPPTPLPHPDDVVFDQENGVRFRGHVDKEGMARLQDAASGHPDNAGCARSAFGAYHQE